VAVNKQSRPSVRVVQRQEKRDGPETESWEWVQSAVCRWKSHPRGQGGSEEGGERHQPWRGNLQEPRQTRWRQEGGRTPGAEVAGSQEVT